MKDKLKRALVSGLRLIVGFGVAAFLVSKVFDRDKFVEEMTLCEPTILAIVPLLFGTVLILTFVRWQRLLHVLDINLSFWTVFRLGMIGAFFNGSLPGAVSGDVVKVIYIRHHAPDRKTEAVLTMLLDRILGLFGLLTVAVASCLVNLNYILSADDKVKLAAGFVGLCSAGGIIACLCVFFRKRLISLSWIGGLVRFGQAKLPDGICNTIQRMVDALDLYRHNLKAVGVALGISILVHTLNAGMLVAAARAIQEHAVPVSRYFLTAQVSNALGSIPLSPGGVGLRDYVTATFLRDAGPKADVIPILVTLSMYFWYLIGGIFFGIGKVGASDDLTDDDEGGARLDSDA